MAFVDELRAARRPRALRPQDEHGLLDLDASLADTAGTRVIYCCGPGPLLDAVEALRARPTGTLRTERFAPDELERADPARTRSRSNWP